MTARLTMLLVAAMAIGLIAVGCGGDDDSDSASNASAGADSGQSVDGSEPSSAEGGDAEESQPIGTSELSGKQYVAKANSLCSKRAEAVVTNEPPKGKLTPNGPSPDELAIEEALVPEFEALTGEIRDLGAPSGQEAQVESFLTALEDDLDTIERTDPKSFEEAEKMLQSSSAQARKAGLSECAFG